MLVTALDIGYQGYTLQDVGKFQIQGEECPKLKTKQNKTTRKEDKLEQGQTDPGHA